MPVKTEYLQLLTFTFGPTVDVLHLYFEAKSLGNSDFVSFLNKQSNKHILFHECTPKVPCCQCISSVSIASPNKKGCLNEKQFNILFVSNSALPTCEKKNRNGIIQHCLCKFSAKHDVQVDVTDISLICNVIKKCCSTMPTHLMGYVNKIKEIRNNVVHVHGNTADFTSTREELEIAVLELANSIGRSCRKLFEQQIQQITSTSDLSELSTRLTNLEHRIERNEVDVIRQNLKTDLLIPLEQKLDSIGHKLDLILKQLGIFNTIADVTIYRPEQNSGNTREGNRVLYRREQESGNSGEGNTVLYRREQDTGNTGEDRSIRDHDVIIKLKTPAAWNRTKIAQKLSERLAGNQKLEENELELVKFEFKCLILSAKASSMLVNDEWTLLSAIGSFLKSIMDECKIDTKFHEKVSISCEIYCPLTLAPAEDISDQLDVIEEDTDGIHIYVEGKPMPIRGRGRKTKRIRGPPKLRCKSADPVLIENRIEKIQKTDIQRGHHETTVTPNEKGMLHKSVQTVEEWNDNSSSPTADINELFFYLLCMFIVEIATDVFREYFKAVILKRKDFPSYLNRQKHIIFHLFDGTKCCMCKESEKVTNKSVSKKQFKAMFDYDEKKLQKIHVKKRKGRTEQKCICGLVAKDETDVSDIDVFFIRAVAAKCEQSTNSNVDTWLGGIVETRKKIFHLSDSKAMSVNNFENHWKTLLKSVQGLSKLVSNDFYFETERRIANLKTKQQLEPTDKLKQEEIYQVEWQNKCAEFECLWTEERLKLEQHFERNYINFPTSSYELFLQRIDLPSMYTKLDKIYLRLYGSNELLRIFLSEGPYVLVTGETQTVPVWLKMEVPEKWNTQQILDAVDSMILEMPSGSQIRIKSCSPDDLNILASIDLRLLKDRPKFQAVLQVLLYDIFHNSGVDFTVKAEVDVLLIVNEVKRRRCSVRSLSTQNRLIFMTHT